MATSSNPTSGPVKPNIFLGVTSALNIDKPTKKDLVATKNMIAAMQPHKVFDTPEGCHLRRKVLLELEKMAKEWIKEMTLSQGLLTMILFVILQNKNNDFLRNI